MDRTGVGLVALLACSACSPTYVLRAGWEEARLLSQRRPIEEVIHDTTVAPAVRGKLRLVEDARDFAVRELGLDAADSFRSYVELSRDTLILAVAAAHELELRWLTWWFPIVGRVPYRGYFDFEDALAEGDRLADEGFDVSVRPVPAFSTAGWLPDPVVSTALRSDSVSVVTTVIHEITHTTFFAAGRADFNESFANFVGRRGAIDFFCRALADERLCDHARRRWEDTRTFGRFFRSIAEPLGEAYAGELSDDEKRARKSAIFRDAARRFEDEVKPELVGGTYRSLNPERLNNAWVLSRLLYYDRLDDFEAVYERHDTLAEALHALLAVARQGNPWAALDSLSGISSTVTPDPPETGQPCVGAMTDVASAPMYNRILVAVDFSDPSVNALEWVARHFPDAEVVLCHVIPRYRPPDYVARALGDELALRAEKELDVRANLEHLGEEHGLDARIEIRSGAVHRQIGEVAQEVQADLVVVGAPRPRPWSQQATDSTVARILDQAKKPLYAWRPVPRLADPEDRTVLAALDLHGGSAAVVEMAAEVAREFKARLIVLHVITRTLQAYLRAVSSSEVVRDTLAKLRSAARADALELVPPALREPLDVQVQVLQGRPVMQILAVAESESANLVVLGGGWGRGVPGRSLLTGVTSRVLRATNSSILVVPR